MYLASQGDIVTQTPGGIHYKGTPDFFQKVTLLGVVPADFLASWRELTMRSSLANILCNCILLHGVSGQRWWFSRVPRKKQHQCLNLCLTGPSMINLKFGFAAPGRASDTSPS